MPKISPTLLFFYFWIIFFVAFEPLCFAAHPTKVMTWNVQDMDIFDGNGLNRPEKQVLAEKSYAAVIRRVSPHILVIVEAPSLVELKYFVRENQLPYKALHVRRQVPRKDFADGMAVLVHRDLEIMDVKLVTPDLPAGYGRKKDWSYRGLMLVEFSDFFIIGAHLKSPWDGKKKSYMKRTAQALSLVHYARGLSKPVIIAGDFNDSPGLSQKESLFRIPDTIGILDKNFHRAPGEETTQKKGHNIDHIFTSTNKVSNRYVEITPWGLSDHRAVWAEIGM